MPCLHWWIPRLGLKLEETGKIPWKTKKVIIIFWGILCRGNIVITWSRCASNLPSLDLWLFPVSCSFLGRRLNQDQLQWGPSRKCRHGAYMLDTLGPRPLSISSSKKQIPFKILYILVKQGIVRVNPTQSQISDGDLIRKKEDAKKIAKLIKKICGQYWNGKKRHQPSPRYSTEPYCANSPHKSVQENWKIFPFPDLSWIIHSPMVFPSRLISQDVSWNFASQADFGPCGTGNIEVVHLEAGNPEIMSLYLKLFHVLSLSTEWMVSLSVFNRDYY